MIIYILALISIIFGSAGQFLLKLAAGQIQTGESILKLGISLLNFRLIGAVAFFATSMLMWVFVLRKMELSIAYPMVSLGYVFVMLLSYFFLQEQLSLPKLLGTGLIVAGVAVLNLK